MVAQQVRVCRVVQCFKSETEAQKARIVLGFSLNDDLRKFTRSAIDQLGGVLCSGKAPPSNLERTLQSFLEDLRE